MITIKTNIEKMPEYCDDCRWYGCKPHPMKGWSNICELMNQCLDDDQEEDWIYDGNDRPKNCPLMEVNVLDKIKEEIRDNTYFINEINEKEGIDFETVEKIIDKYKAESEE